MGFAEKEQSRAKKRSAVSTALSGIDTDKQLEGQESIDTLEGGKYMPPASETIEESPNEKITHREEEKRKGRPPVNRETKKRISLAVFPSVYEDIGKIAYVDRDTISNLIGKCLEEYIQQNQDKIAEYDRLKK